jgi:hypothetical protein
MARHTVRIREEARRLHLEGELTSVAEIARRLKVKAQTVARWKREEDWDALRLKIDRRAAEQLVERLASERVALNTQHFKLWGAVVSRLFSSLTKEGLESEGVRNLEKVAAVLERAQRGQRLARGLSLDGQTEEQIRAQAEADGRALIDGFIEIVKDVVTDEETRDRIARAIMERCPVEEDPEASVH